jgi:SulP family sulfate permease
LKSAQPINPISFKYFKQDSIAAITVVMMAIPQGMAYAVLAGVPPIYGLYTFVIPLLIYPLFSSSKYMSVGPTAIVAIIMVTGLCDKASVMSAEFIQLSIMVSLMAGIIQMGMSFLKMGFLVNFLSHPVLKGFTSAAGVIIIIGQLKYALGVQIERTQNLLGTITELIKNIQSSSIPAIGLFVCSLIGILFFKKIKKAFPAALIFIVIGSLLVFILKLEAEVPIIGDVPSGLPSVINPLVLDSAVFISLLPLAGVISFISFVESLAIAKSLDGKEGKYEVDANKELLGLGMAKFIGAFFQAIPSTGSFSRSALNDDSGAKTGLSSIIAACLIGISLLLFTKAFYYIPYAVLAAIIIGAVYKLIDYKTAVHLYNTDRGDFWVMIITFLVTLSFGVLTGITTGIALSLLLILRKVSAPHYAVLGKIDESGIYKNVNRFEEAIVNDEILIIRYDDDIFFGNAIHFFDSILSEIENMPSAKILILDMSSISNIDSTGIIQLRILIQELNSNSMSLHIAGPKGPLRDRLQSEGIYDLIGIQNIHLTIAKTMQALQP